MVDTDSSHHETDPLIALENLRRRLMRQADAFSDTPRVSTEVRDTKRIVELGGVTLLVSHSVDVPLDIPSGADEMRGIMSEQRYQDALAGTRRDRDAQIAARVAI